MDSFEENCLKSSDFSCMTDHQTCKINMQNECFENCAEDDVENEPIEEETVNEISNDCIWKCARFPIVTFDKRKNINAATTHVRSRKFRQQSE